jgi:hypothetical protein
MACESEEVLWVQSALATLEEKSYPLSSCGSWMERLDTHYVRHFEETPKIIFVPHVSGGFVSLDANSSLLVLIMQFPPLYVHVFRLV